MDYNDDDDAHVNGDRHHDDIVKDCCDDEYDYVYDLTHVF